MGRDTNLRQQCENMLGNAVIQYTLTADGAFFLRIEGGRVILEILDDGAGLRPFIEDLGFAFINLAATDLRGRLVIGTLCRSEEHTSELQSLMRISYAVFCLKKKKNTL